MDSILDWLHHSWISDWLLCSLRKRNRMTAEQRERLIQDLMDDLDYPDPGTETAEERIKIRETYEALSDDKLAYEWELRFT